jgi:cytochrome c oxidase subunit II
MRFSAARHAAMIAADHSHQGDAASRAERRWASVAVGCVAVILAVIIFTSIHWSTLPPSGVEPIDPTTLHVSGEFVEANLGARAQPNGSVVVHMIAQQYSFNPQCLTLPADTPVMFRATSADAVHGLFIMGTNTNAMLIPGYVTSFTTRFSKTGAYLMPCQEFCGTGHAAMWARITIVSPPEFARISAAKSGNHCV